MVNYPGVFSCSSDFFLKKSSLQQPLKRSLNLSFSSGVILDIFSWKRCFQKPPSCFLWHSGHLFLPNPEKIIFERTNIPKACQKLISGPVNKSGTSQFQSCINTKAKSTTANTPNMQIFENRKSHKSFILLN